MSPAEQMDYSALCGLQENDYNEADIRRMRTLRALVDAFYRGQVRRDDVQGQLAAAQVERGDPRVPFRPWCV